MEIDVANWSRIVEVVNYAEGHGIDLAEAIERLVNQGLSHDDKSWL